jgi:hypothetical protein
MCHICMYMFRMSYTHVYVSHELSTSYPMIRTSPYLMTRTRTHAHTRTHTHTHARTHAYAHTHAHTHAHTYPHRYTGHIAAALAYLHRQGLAHGALDLSHCLVAAGGVVKVSPPPSLPPPPQTFLSLPLSLPPPSFFLSPPCIVALPCRRRRDSEGRPFRVVLFPLHLRLSFSLSTSGCPLPPPPEDLCLLHYHPFDIR